ncbi:hypothetical protein J3E68DRAFT_171620 [Trichoderma sp. SZMC 28012]
MVLVLGKLAEGPSRCNPKGTCACAASCSGGTCHFLCRTVRVLLVLVAFLPGAFAGAAAGKLFLGGSFLVERLWIPGLEFAVINLAWHGRERETGDGNWAGLELGSRGGAHRASAGCLCLVEPQDSGVAALWRAGRAHSAKRVACLALVLAFYLTRRPGLCLVSCFLVHGAGCPPQCFAACTALLLPLLLRARWQSPRAFTITSSHSPRMAVCRLVA